MSVSVDCGCSATIGAGSDSEDISVAIRFVDSQLPCDWKQYPVSLSFKTKTNNEPPVKIQRTQYEHTLHNHTSARVHQYQKHMRFVCVSGRTDHLIRKRFTIKFDSGKNGRTEYEIPAHTPFVGLFADCEQQQYNHSIGLHFTMGPQVCACVSVYKCTNMLTAKKSLDKCT